MIRGQQTERMVVPPGIATPSRTRPPGARRAAMSARDVAILRSLADRIDPSDAGAHNNLGVVFFQKGLIDDAIAAFVRALDLDPHLEMARRNAQIASVETGYLRRRVEELEAHLREFRDDDGARDALARTYLLGGDPAAAAQHWSRLLVDHPQSTALHMKLAHAEADRGRPKRALALLGRAADLSPEDPAVQFQLADLLTREGAHEPAEAAARRGLTLDGGAIRGHVLLGRILEAMGRTEEASRAYDRAKDLDPTALRPDGYLSLERYRAATSARATRVTTPTVEDDTPLGRYARAAELRRAGDLEGAAHELERAGEVGGADAFEIRLALAEIRLMQGAVERAVDLYDRLVEERDDSPKIWNERGVAVHRLGRLGEAIESYRRAVALDHTYLLGWNNLGVARAQRGDGGAAERAFRQAAGEGAPVEILRNLSLFLLRSEAAGEAVEVVRVAIDLDPESSRSWCRLGSALFQAGRSMEARDALLRALELDPDDAEGRYQLGFVLSALGDFKGALRETKQALELDPVFPAPRYQLLIDVEFEDGAVAAPDTDPPRRLDPGTAIPSFEFEPEAFSRAFAQLEPAAPVVPSQLEDARERAREALRRGQLPEAAEHCGRALAVDPADTEALLLQGTIFLQQGLPGEALERFDAVLARAPDHLDAATGRARALLDLDRPADALAAAEEAVQVAGRTDGDGDVERAHALLGRARLTAGDSEGAIAAFEMAVATDDPGVAPLTYYGQALLACGRAANAEAVFRRVVAGAPGAVAARTGLAVALGALGLTAAAEKEYRAALYDLPSYGPAALGLASLCWDADRREEALAVLVDFLAVDPTHVDGLVHLGSWLEEMERPDQAAAALRRALRFDPDHDQARDRLTRLATPGS
jgi:cellulose synthase operon protein C